ncbi:MAG TPA: hypothetical protein VFT45_03040 [Longimicrobium sp.]|nr:hypothetical protein [Longimicrobium sp.]
MRPFSLLVLLLLPCVACRPSEAASDVHSARGSTADCGDGAALALTERASVPLPPSAAPAGLALLADGSLVMAERGSSGVSVRAADGASTRWIAAPEPLPVLSPQDDELLAAGLTAVYRIDTGRGRVDRLMDVPLRAGRIVSLAGDGRTLWVGVGGLAGGAGAVYAVSRARPGEWRRRPMDAPVHLAPAGDGRVAAAGTRAPHRVAFLDSTLAVTGSAQPPARRRRGADARFTQALVPLDCGRLLHVVADLRSDRRELTVYQAAPRPRLLRARTIERPIGFVHTRAGRSMVAVTEGEGRREVVLLGWSWQP